MKLTYTGIEKMPMNSDEEKKIKDMLKAKKQKILKNTKAIEIGLGLKDDRQLGSNDNQVKKDK